MRSAVRTTSVSVDRTRFGGISSTQFALFGMLALAFVVRLLFINADGFRNDVSTFESWSLTLAEHPIRQFFANAGFADYPPGYFFVLWIVGHAYKLLIHADPTYGILKLFVKLPGVVMDVVDSWLIYLIVRRFASIAWSFAAAAFFAFNPATIFISAYWGQVDSVAAGLTLGSLLLMIDSDRATGRRSTIMIACAWLLLAYSVLIKPPAVVIAPLYFAFIFASDQSAVRIRRAIATWIGVAGGLFLAYLAAFAFVPSGNPVTLATWLVGRYAYASGVYAYNSVNAFNLYVLGPGNHFWQPDNNLVPNASFGFPLYIWGIGLFVAATLLVISRSVQRREPIALLEGAAILSLGYFVLSTRMHERYIFNALLLAVPLIFYKKRYLYAAVIISLTLLGNLFYSLDYLYVMDNKVPNVDPTDLIPWLSRVSAFFNVVTFFYLGYVYLGNGEDVLEGLDLPALAAGAGAKVRHWFSPTEGVAWMTLRDWQIAGFLTVSSFVLTFIDYTWPIEKIFDEIYYARAGEEYLGHKEIFEFTHPPLTKLWITLSMILFGGLEHGGDTSAGWRFLNLVMGAVMVLVLYCFAKRLLGSTLFATIAASLLLFDGFHYVQSRIATPEITVAFFALLTLYCFYRFWLASQVRVTAAFSAATLGPQALVFAAGLVIAGIFSAIVAAGQDSFAHVVAFGYLALGAYLAARLVTPRFLRAPEVTSFPEGSRIRGNSLVTLDGGIVPIGNNGPIVPGQSSALGKNTLVHEEDGVHIEYSRNGSVKYLTNGGGEATFSPDGTVTVGASVIDGRKDGLLWMFLLAASAGALGASKWNGLFDFFVIWFIAAGVVMQGIWGPLKRAVGNASALSVPATWGNPFGISLDILIVAMLFIGSTIYTLCYIPYFSLHHNLSDLLGLQSQMFGYHYDLKATHPYGSKWWQWPFIGRPISYYYHDWRTGAETQNAAACCVAEIIALPNPAVWWFGLVSVPAIAWFGWTERNKGYLLLVTAYLLQWLPWATSPRVAFEYHFFPNLAIICLADAVILQRLWNYTSKLAAERNVRHEANYVGGAGILLGLLSSIVIGTYAIPLGIFVAVVGYLLVVRGRARWPQVAVGGYLALVFTLFAFFYPVLAGLHVPWYVWDGRMWHAIMHDMWI